MRLISRYFPFLILTMLLYGLFFYHSKQSTIVRPLLLNSGQQAVQLQFTEITKPLPTKTAETEPEEQEIETPEESTKTAEKAKVEEAIIEKTKIEKVNTKEITKTAENNKTVEQAVTNLNSKNQSEIKVAKKRLQKAIQGTAAINDAMLKAELFAVDYKQDPTTPGIAAKSPKKTAAELPTRKRKTIKIISPVKALNKQEVLPHQEKPKRIFKKQLTASQSGMQNPGVLQEAIVVSGNRPVYPKRAILRNQEGRVQVKLTVTMKGKAKNPQIMISSGHSILDDAVLDFIRQELFMPAHQGEEKITREQIFSFRFELR